MVSDHEMRMEALRLYEENERLMKSLRDIAAVTFCPKCRGQKQLNMDAEVTKKIYDFVSSVASLDLDILSNMTPPRMFVMLSEYRLAAIELLRL